MQNVFTKTFVCKLYIQNIPTAENVCKLDDTIDFEKMQRSASRAISIELPIFYTKRILVFTFTPYNQLCKTPAKRSQAIIQNITDTDTDSSCHCEECMRITQFDQR